MAKAVFIPNSPAVEDVETWDTEIDAPQTEQQRRLEDVLAGLNDTTDKGYLAAYRQSGAGNEAQELVEKFPVDQFESREDLLLYLRDKYGPGQYRVHVRINGKLRANTLERVAAPIVSKAPSTDNAALNTVLAQMEKMQQQMMVLAQQVHQRPARDDDAEELRVLQKMQMYKSLFADNRPSGGLGEIQNALEFVKGLGIQVGLPGPKEESDDDGFGALIEKAAPLFQMAMQQPQQPQPQAQPRPQPSQEQHVNIFRQAQLKAGISALMKAASKNANPATYAEWLIDQVGEETAAQQVTAPDSFDKLCKLAPHALGYKSWFDELSEHVKGSLGLQSKYSDLYEGEISGDTGDTVSGD